ERWQPSAIPALEVPVTLAGETDAHALADLFDQAGYAAQDWTTSIRLLCKQCSERQPPEDHEHPVPPLAAERRFGLAAPLDLATRLRGGGAGGPPGPLPAGRSINRLKRDGGGGATAWNPPGSRPTLIGVVGDHGKMAQICWRTGARNCTRPCHSNRATPGQRPARGSGPSAQDT